MRELPKSRIAVLVCLSALVAACGTDVAATASPNAVTPSLVAVVSRQAVPTPTPTPPTPPPTGRLTEGFDQGYDPRSPSLGNYRMDPAPASLHPRLTGAQVLAALYRSSDASFAREKGAHLITRFGLFSGFDATAKNGTFGPTRPVVRRPAWLVVISGVLMTSSGGGAVGPGQTQPPRETPAPGWTLIVIYDDTGQPQGIVTQQGGDPHIR